MNKLNTSNRQGDTNTSKIIDKEWLQSFMQQRLSEQVVKNVEEAKYSVSKLLGAVLLTGAMVAGGGKLYQQNQKIADQQSTIAELSNMINLLGEEKIQLIQDKRLAAQEQSKNEEIFWEALRGSEKYSFIDEKTGNIFNPSYYILMEKELDEVIENYNALLNNGCEEPIDEGDVDIDSQDKKNGYIDPQDVISDTLLRPKNSI